VTRRREHLQLGIACAFAVLVSDLALAQQPPRAAVQSRPALRTGQQQQLSRAITLFATDDDGPEAEQLFQRVIQASSVGASDGATARYYLGRLYHRNYYMLNHRQGLDRAAELYKELHSRLGAERRGPWYAEARFYKSLAYLQLGKWRDVYEAVDHIDPTLDAEIEIDYLVWAVNKRPINRRVSSAELKAKYLAILRGKNITMSRRGGVDQRTTEAVIAELQRLLERWPTARTPTTAR
jgi:hypothetical protein